MAEPAGLTIGEVSRLLGVPVPTLRSWHRRYGVALPGRTGGGHRRYATTDVEVLQALSSAVSRGIAPRTAAQALRSGARTPQESVDLLDQLLERAGAGDQPGFVAVLDRVEQDSGVEQTVDRLLIPALRELGRRWEVQLVDVAVEHLATSAARGWIASRAARAQPQHAVAPVLLAGAPGNQHTVGLEAFGMLLRRRGWPVRELGADTPVASLLSALDRTGAQAVVVTAHQASRRRAAVTALEAVTQRAGVHLLYAGGAFDEPTRRRGVPGSYLGTDIPRAVRDVEQLLVSASPEPGWLARGTRWERPAPASAG